MAINYKDYITRDQFPTDYYKSFEARFEAKIEDSKDYRQYIRTNPYPIWDGRAPYDMESKVVPMKAIHLTTDSLERLVREQERMEHLESDAKYGKELWTMLRADERVRDDNPAVAKAYRNYLTLLELARK